MNSLGLLQALCIGLAVKMFGTTGRHAWSMKRGLRALGFPPSLLEPLAQSYVGWELEVMKHLRYELPLPKTM